MNHLFNLLLVALLLVNLLGLALWVRGLSQLPFGLAKVVTVVGGCLVLFCVEHFLGLGPLGWLLPVATVGALWGIWKYRHEWKAVAGAELAFLAGFGVCLLWRYSFPDLDPAAERAADLNYVASYLAAGRAGARLPVPDLWLHGYAITSYYTFQHYAAALLGRVLSLSAGASCHLAYCVATGLVLAPAYEWVRAFTARPIRQALLLAALLLGGTGACVVTPFTMKADSPFASMRFIGCTNVSADAALTPLGIRLRDAEYGPRATDPARLETILDLPDEIFSYIVYLGDYHPPLGGYVLLAAALAAFGVLLGAPGKKGAPQLPGPVPRRWATGALLATVPLAVATNAWIFPLQALLVAGCLAFLWRYRERPRWEEVAAAGLAPCILLYPWLSIFLGQPGGEGMKLAPVPEGMHTPPLSFLLQMWPVLGLFALAWFSLGKERRAFRWFLAAIVLGFLAGEWLHIDELLSGRYERFNTTLKWWPWLGALTLLLGGALSLADANRSRFTRIATVVILGVTLFHAVTLGRDWAARAKPSLGQLDGGAWLRRIGQDPADPTKLTITASILNYLEARPGGAVLEPPVAGRTAYVETGIVSLLTGHPAVFGWASHEQLWRSYQRDIEQRLARAGEFFRGDLADPLAFLAQQDVRFILWPAAQDVAPALFQKVQLQIESRYAFIRFDEGQPLKGIWQRKEPAN